MSEELALLPMIDNDNFSHEVLIVRDFELFDAIKALPQLELQREFNSYLGRDEEDQFSCYGKTMETPYGDLLTYTNAKHLKTVGLTGPTGAYVAALHDLTRIALYWH